MIFTLKTNNMAQLENMFSVKFVNGRGIALVPELEDVTNLTPAIQLSILVTVFDYFVNSAIEEHQSTLEGWLLENFKVACESRHEWVDKMPLKSLEEL